MSPEYTKILVIGAGPVGLFSIFTCGMLGMPCSVLDTLPVAGGQCRALYPEKPIYDIPAFPKILSEDFIQQLEEQIKPFRPHFFLEESAISLERISLEKYAHLQEHFDIPLSKIPAVWRVHTSMGRSFITLCVLVCSGGGALVPKRPPLSHVEQFEGKSIFYHVSKKERFKGKKIVIAGGGDSAVDWAVLLAPDAEIVHMIHRRHNFRAQDSSVQALNQLIECGKIILHVPYQLDTVSGDPHGMLHGVTICHLENQEKTKISCDYFLPFFGIDFDMGPLLSWGLEMEKGRIIAHPTAGTTNLPGIYAAGDASIYPHKLKLIVTGFGEVANIAHHIQHYLFPEKSFSFQHSTTTGIKGF